MADSLFDNNDNDPMREELTAKWKDKPLEEVLKAKIESDLYIKTLERQKDELRTDYLKLREEATAQAKLQELLDRLEKSSSNSNVTTTPVNNLENQPQYNPKDVEALVSQTMLKQKAEEKMTDNFNMVKGKLSERYGNNYQTALQESMNTLGLTGDELNEMARTRPNVLIRALGLNEPTQQNLFQNPVRSSQRSDNFSPHNEKRTWAYYQKLKKDNPTLYFNKKTQFQMHQDAGALGTAFEDGDFHVFG